MICASANTNGRSLARDPAFRLVLCALAVMLMTDRAAFAQTVRQLVRIQGQEISGLQGLGLVVGLNGTGDSAKSLALARPLAEVLRNNGNPIASFDELGKSKSAALVMVTVTIPEEGARTGDRFDAHISVLNGAKSLQGGMLYMAPLTPPVPGSMPYAIAQGLVELDDDQIPTQGRVRDGASMIRDVRTGTVGNSFTLIVKPYFAGWPSVSEIASRINQEWFGTDDLSSGGAFAVEIATPIDDREIQINIPDPERDYRAGFIADVLSTPINTALLRLPAQVIVNSRTGAIVVTGDVRISPVAITHKDLTITTTIPTPVPTEGSPVVQRKQWTGVTTGAKPGDLARLDDLLNAFKQLDIPVDDQITILSMLNKTGKLHARLIRDE